MEGTMGLNVLKQFMRSASFAAPHRRGYPVQLVSMHSACARPVEMKHALRTKNARRLLRTLVHHLLFRCTNVPSYEALRQFATVVQRSPPSALCARRQHPFHLVAVNSCEDAVSHIADALGTFRAALCCDDYDTEKLQMFTLSLQRAAATLARAACSDDSRQSPRWNGLLCLASGVAKPADVLQAIRPHRSTHAEVIVFLAVPWDEVCIFGRSAAEELWDAILQDNTADTMEERSFVRHVVPIPMAVAESPTYGSTSIKQKTHPCMWVDAMNAYWVGILAQITEVVMTHSSCSELAMGRGGGCTDDAHTEHSALHVLVVHHDRETVRTMKDGVALQCSGCPVEADQGRVIVRFEVVDSFFL